LVNLAQPDDLAVAISGSGNSPNVLRAVEWANQHGLITFGMTGFDGGQLKRIQQYGLHVPTQDLGMVESLHACVLHWIVDDLYARLHKVARYQAS